ncbi:MAG: hypothetical protein WCA32_06875 [Chromatiaceae bacterium]
MIGRNSVFVVLVLIGVALLGGPAGAEDLGLDVKTVGNISYVSGGVGVSDRQALEQVKSKFNLRLLFAYTKSGEFLADIPVKIVDGAGKSVLDAVSAGPYFYAKLPPGRYRVSADNEGQVQTKSVTVSSSGAASEAFYWSRP